MQTTGSESSIHIAGVRGARVSLRPTPFSSGYLPPYTVLTVEDAGSRAIVLANGFVPVMSWTAPSPCGLCAVASAHTCISSRSDLRPTVLDIPGSAATSPPWIRDSRHRATRRRPRGPGIPTRRDPRAPGYGAAPCAVLSSCSPPTRCSPSHARGRRVSLSPTPLRAVLVRPVPRRLPSRRERQDREAARSAEGTGGWFHATDRWDDGEFFRYTIHGLALIA
jgi:hypothetical protein